MMYIIILCFKFNGSGLWDATRPGGGGGELKYNNTIKQY